MHGKIQLTSFQLPEQQARSLSLQWVPYQQQGDTGDLSYRKSDVVLSRPSALAA